MGLLERLAELTKALLTTESELRYLRDGLSDIRQEAQRIRGEVQDLRDRIVRLEATRAADHAQKERFPSCRENAKGAKARKYEGSGPALVPLPVRFAFSSFSRFRGEKRSLRSCADQRAIT
jgi:regulator of replication initiation timing